MRIETYLDSGLATFGVWARHLGTGETIAWLAEEPFPPASTIKLPILCAALAAGAPLDTPLTLLAAHQVPGTGVLKDLTPGLTLSLRDAAMLMTTVSDNAATNLVLDFLGVAAVNDFLSREGFPATRLYRKIWSGPGPLANATPEDLGRLMYRLARREILTPDACATALDMLSRQQDHWMLPRYLPEEARVYNKTGMVQGVRADFGLVEAPGGAHAICVMAKGCTDDRYHPENAVEAAMGRLSLAVYRHFHG